MFANVGRIGEEAGIANRQPINFQQLNRKTKVHYLFISRLFCQYDVMYRAVNYKRLQK